MRVPLDEGFLKWAVGAVGMANLVEMIQEDLATRAAPQTQTEFLDGLGIRGHWQRAVVRGVIRNYADLATVIRVAELPLDVLTGMPWHLVRPRDELAVVQGVRAVDIPEVSRAVRQRSVGAHDALALTTIANACRRLRLDAELMPYPVPGELAAADADGYLAELCGRTEVGAVVVLGSQVVNPLAEPLARVALGGRPAPARFRWTFFAPGPDSVLSVPGTAPLGQEGVVIPDQPGVLHPRSRDDANQNGGPLFDCGMLLIDARERPLRVLCAGHGGCGTVAAAQTLADHALLTRLLAASYDEKLSLLGPNVVLVVVAVERRPGGLGLGASPGDAREIVRRRVVWSSTLVDGLDV